MIEFFIGASVGVAVGYWLRPSNSASNIYEYATSTPVLVDDARWQSHWYSFNVQCALGHVLSERDVVNAGIVASVTHYRQFAKLNRRYGVWWWPGAANKKQWVDRNPLIGVRVLRDQVARGRVRPRWPHPTPPLVYAVSDVSAADNLAD